jgi:hypothetical protein
MTIYTKLWILSRPRLIYVAIIPAMVAGCSLGFALAGLWGSLVCGSLSLWFAFSGYALFRIRLLRTTDDSFPPEPPTEGSPRPAPLHPITPLIQAAHAELPDDRNG